MLKQKKILILAVVLIAALGGAGVLLWQRNHPASSRSAGTNLRPATKQDHQRAEDNKQNIVKNEANQKNQPAAGNAKQAVKPTITYAGQYGDQVEVGAYVSGIFEDGGTCTATFKRNDQAFSKQVQAVKGSSNVNCPAMTASASEFQQKGSWSVTVSYGSAAAAGSSDARQFEVK